MDKVCKTCGELKLIECFNKDFYKDKIYHRHQCKHCENKSRKEYNKQYNKQYAPIYYAKNKTSIKQYQKQYWLNNRERLKENNRLWREKNKEKKRETDRHYDKNNRECRSVYRKQWAKDNPEKEKFNSRKRQAIKRKSVGDFNACDIIVIREKQKDLCFYCGGKLKDNYHIDHFIPLSKGGNNYPSNLRLACPSCNQKKSNRSPQEFIQTEFLRLFY